MNQQLQAVLQRSGTLTPGELDLSVRQAVARKLPLWEVLVLERRVPEETLARAFCISLDLPRVQIDSTEVESTAIGMLAGTLARKHTCLPIRLNGRHLVLAMSNPLDQRAIEDVQFACSRRVQPVVACRSEILAGIETHYGARSAPKSKDEPVFARGAAVDDTAVFDQVPRSQSSDEASAILLCREIIADAVEAGASDIHIEPGQQELRVRLRVDGVLRNHLQLPRWMHASLVSRLKILSKMDIAQQRLPQDGRMTIARQDRALELRVSTLPTQFGEKAVLRLLGSGRTPTLLELGFSTGEAALIDEGLNQPQGLILVTGPTGSGKTTTLYSMLARRQSPEVNVVTIEDPIEYEVPGASQVQVDSKSGLTFASALRSILRQDPDVILVGEIRDAETAEIAFQAALTGHLVLSSLHTNGSLAAVERLLDLGLRPLIITSAINLIMAQRLARRICRHCQELYVPDSSALRRLGLEPASQEFVHGRGCARCSQTGYAGRVGLFEILRLTPELKTLVSRNATQPELVRGALAAGTRLLLGDARDKIRDGLTTPEEILRVIRTEQPGDDAAREALSAGGGNSY